MSTYDQVVSAVINYYSSDSDIYKKVMSGQGLTVGEMNAVLSSVPYMQPVTSISGSRIGIDASIPFKDPTNNIEFIVGDSNLGGSSYGSGYSGNIPGTSTYDPSSSTFTLESGANSAGSILPVVADKLSLAVTGVNIGAKLGFKIDQALYENFPDFWQEIFGNITPSDFANIFSEDTLGNKFLRTLFGIENGDITCYVSEDAIAATYQALRDAGVFNNGEVTPDVYPGQDENFIVSGESILSTVARNCPIWASGGNNPFTRYGWSAADVIANLQNALVNAGINPDDYVGDFVSEQTSGNGRIIHKNTICKRGGQTNDFRGWQRFFYTIQQSVGSPNIQKFSIYNATYNGQHYPYVDMYGVAGPANPYYYLNSTNTYQQGNYIYYATSGMMMHVSPAIDGISQMDQTQAPLGVPDPAIINGTNVPTILSQLKQNYPDLFQNPITQSIPQEDGSTRIITYYPVPFPHSTSTTRPTTQDTPTTGTTPQVVPYVDPTTGTTTYIVPTIDEDTASDILIDPVPTSDPITQPTIQPEPVPEPSPDPTPQPETPVTPETPPPGTNPPDTGEGEAEPIILPIGEASALWSVYNPTQSQLNQFGAWLWSPNFIDNIIRIFTSPMDGVIGIHKIFVTPPQGPASNIAVGYLDSGVSSITVPTQFTEVSCGTVDLQEYFGNVFDYSPFTEVSIYLPFIGVAKLDVADVMRSRITVSYGVDVYTGSCLAKVSVERDGYESILYSFGGDCSVHYPLSSGSYSGLISSIVSAGAAALTSGIASGGNPVVGAAAAGTSFLSHNKGLSVQHTGGFTGNSGATGPKIPYLIIKRPQVLMADNFEQYDGYPANHTTSIGSCSGYIRCKIVHLEVPNAYKEELDEIERLLKQGILI